MIDDVNFLGNEFSDTWILPLEDISLDSLILDPPGSSAPDLFPIIILAVGVAVISIFLVMRVKKRKVQRRLRR